VVALSGFSVGGVDSVPLEISHLLFADDICSCSVRRIRITFSICDLSLFGLKLLQAYRLTWVNRNWFKLVMCHS
jgi:hypothetical protein